MSKVVIELNSDGIRELLKDDGIAEICRQQAEEVASKAGEGYGVESRSYAERSGYAVVAQTKEAYKDNLKNNTLLKALGV